MNVAGTLDLHLTHAPVRAFASVAPAAPRAASVPDAKRTFDLVAASVLLLLFLPFLLVVAVCIEATSPGPALFVQWRVGRRGRLFRMFKLRTMVHDAERSSGPVWAQDADPRTTALGRFLRASHLDELPQLWNVVLGDMSLVGPRPERPVFVQDFTRRFPNYAARLEVRPGITGLAQVRQGYDRSVSDVRRKLAYDLFYVRRRSPLLDLAILLRTPLEAIPVDGREDV